MSRLNIAVLVDRGCLSRFEAEVVREAARDSRIAVFSCTNTASRRRPLKHLFYYLLNLWAVRNPLARKVPLRSTGLALGETIEFQAEHDRGWHRFPAAVQERIRTDPPDLILKFGMGLLRVPADFPPLVSFHHGDPESYRGRPAGFYEMLHGCNVMGQMVQVLSDRLDAGEVLAFGETKIHAHSYRKTLIEAYALSPLLVAEALRNLRSGTRVDRQTGGHNYRLPSNLTVLRFGMRMFRKAAARLLYGLLKEKRWQVSRVPLADPIALARRQFPDRSSWVGVPQLPQYAFYADPFLCDEGLLVEALNRLNGRGEIVLIDKDQHRLTRPGLHFSYPSVTHHRGDQYILPEIARWSEPIVYRIEDSSLQEVGPLKGVPRVLDPTIVHHGDRVYLFGNDAKVGGNALFLWTAADLFGEFHPHPASPIRLSPRGSRMAGPLLDAEGKLYRFGQDNTGAYGDGVLVYEITEITADSYAERLVNEIRFDAVRGPHTISVRGGEVAFDWYREKISPVAGLRRLLGRHT